MADPLRSFLFASSLLSLAAAGCSWTSDGGLGARIESDVRAKSSEEGSYRGEPLHIEDEHGQIEIVGVPGKTNITVHAKMVAGAQDQADADAAFDDLFAGITIEKERGSWTVRCGQASAWHGSVDPESTGCTRLRIEVPAGSIDAPLALVAVARYGGVHVTGVVVSKLEAKAPFGLMADVTPARGAEIALHGDPIVSGFCSSVLRVPAGFAADEVELTVEDVHLEYAGDPDGRFVPGVSVEGVSLAARTPLYRGAVGEKGTGAARVALHADQGKAAITTEPLPPAQDMNACTNYDPIEVEAAGSGTAG